MEKSIRIKHFTKKQFSTFQEILKDWGYDEWLEYDLIETSENENVDVTFYIEGGNITLSEFVVLVFDAGYESAFYS